MQWYYAEGDLRKGPIDETQFNELVKSGVIHGGTLVWHSGLANWQPYASISGAGVGAGVAVGAVSHPTAFSYGGFWLRFLAKIVDAIALYIASIPLKIVFFFIFGTAGSFNTAAMGRASAQFLGFFGISTLANVALAVLYTWFFVSRFDATPGKMALGLKLVRADGSKLSTGRIIGRYFAEWISAIILMIGYIMAAFDAEKRALHDYICDTRVIKSR